MTTLSCKSLAMLIAKIKEPKIVYQLSLGGFIPQGLTKNKTQCLGNEKPLG